jgi:alpha-L-fucosidase 2
MIKYFLVLAIQSLSITAYTQIEKYTEALKFDHLPGKWDEALPIGNGKMGALIWQKADKLRISLDHAELWDLRPMTGINTKGFNYKWVKQQLDNNNYDTVQKIGDEPYEREAAPCKLPGAAFEFETGNWGNVLSSSLNIEDATSHILWANGVKMTSFVHANQPYGYIRFENCKDIILKLLPPKYQGDMDKESGGSIAGDDLTRLGYTQGKVIKNEQRFIYTQKGWGGFYYTVAVKWIKVNAATTDYVWTITAHQPNTSLPNAAVIIKKAATYVAAFSSHLQWWKNFWSKSSIAIPDSLMERQWYLEQYKFGSVARADAPPISLQAIWTADNGRLPPWKGDFHHDLNTQLSYWPAYSGNHLEEAMGYINYLEKNKAAFKKYTKQYYGSDGLNVPGVTTLTGQMMGGWIQYSLSPTIAAWLAHHYYLQWRYGMDRNFLKTKAYPWFKDVAKYIEQITYIDKNGYRQLPLSSSPEINDNDKTAWFKENTNYDLSLMKFVFAKAKEIALELNLKADASKFKKIAAQFSSYYLTGKQEFKIARDLPHNISHRHFSHLMSIYPLGEIRWENGSKDSAIIKNSIHLLDVNGPKQWVGYSYAWLGNLKARAKDGEGAAVALKDFATSFCSPNSFHLNGDQSGSGKSDFTYRPFTLEGNFAYAAGIQEMLLQAYAGFIEVFPAVPATWLNVSFKTLRAEGAFLVSAKRAGGHTDEVAIVAEKGGTATLKLPFRTHVIQSKSGVTIEKITDEFIVLHFQKGGSIVIDNGYE